MAHTAKTRQSRLMLSPKTMHKALEKSPDRLKVDAEIVAPALKATQAFVARIAQTYPMQEAILFGSRARGTEHEESDADVAIILKGKTGHFIKTKMAMNDIAYDILLDTGIRIQPLPVWESEWEHPERYSNPHLLYNIAQEGIAL